MKNLLITVLFLFASTAFASKSGNSCPYSGDKNTPRTKRYDVAALLSSGKARTPRDDDRTAESYGYQAGDRGR